MTPELFEEVFEHQVKHCRMILIHKAAEYANNDDRLHNFKKAAALTGESQRQALAGMLVKHVVSLFDMLGDENAHPMSVWDEKITDSLNYHFLLKAVLVEEDSYDEIQKKPLPPRIAYAETEGVTGA